MFNISHTLQVPRSKRIFKILTGYDWHNFESFNNFTKWLHRPVDASALSVFRTLYGVAMLIDIAEERGGGQLDFRFGEPQHCHFPLFSFITAVEFPIMGCIYLCMWLGALGITCGYRFKLSCFIFIVPYWYIFLLDKSAWNNHSYLFGLVGSILYFTQANSYCSMDKYLNPTLPETVPYWNYFVIKFQFFLLYMYAGLKKFTAEWLSGYAMSNLSQHWIFAPFRLILTVELTDLLIVHWFTAVFDFTIAFFMTWNKTRLWALPFMLSFHLMNSRLFVIGMFPWVCLAQVTMFFGFDWPRRFNVCKFLSFGYFWKSKSVQINKHFDPNTIDSSRVVKQMCNSNIVTCNKVDFYKMQYNKTTQGPHIRTAIILLYCGLQLFLPYSHFLTEGFNNWTNGLYGYSWDMMVYSYDTILTSIKIVDNNNDNVHYLNPYAFTEYDRWTKYPDMALQYAKCIQFNILADYVRDPKGSPLSTTNFSIYFDIWCSMNGRLQQRVFDPRVDLLTAEWSPFRRTSWALPLLNELSHLRPKLRKIANEVLTWNNYSDAIFVADFPGLTLNNYISRELTNISLTILEGDVHYKSDNENIAYVLTAGKSFKLQNGVTHHVTTIGSKPSCYLYTYVNKTMLDSKANFTDAIKEPKLVLPLWGEFKNRLVNYNKFFTHIANSVLFLLYNVPIPIARRERD